jgi:hypothetical protein
MPPPNTLAAAVLVCTAGLTVFSLTSCADSNVDTGRTPAMASANPVRTTTGNEDSAMRPRTRAEVEDGLNQAIANGWHIDKGD